MRAHRRTDLLRAGVLVVACLALQAAACAGAPQPEGPAEAPPQPAAAPADNSSEPAAPAAGAGGAAVGPESTAPPTAGEGLVKVREPLVQAEPAAPPATTTIAELTAELERTRQQRNRLQVEAAAAQREAALWRQRAEALAAGTSAAAPAQPAAPEPATPKPAAPLPATPEPTAPVPAAPVPAAEPLDRLVSAVYGWADAWSGQQVEEYLSFYARGFRPPEGLSRREWEAERRRRLLAPRFIQVEISSLQAAPQGDGRVRVTFRQTYRSDRYSDAVAKELMLVEEDGAWRIESEDVRR